MEETHLKNRATEVAMIAEQTKSGEQIVRDSEFAPNEQRLGVSVVICTYNGAARLPQTLAHLALQRNTDNIAWEVLVIDNASTDDSAETARRCWPVDASAPLRVVDEPRIGLSSARTRGFAEARYEIVSFVDDDNWVAEDWIRRVSDTMSADSMLGAFNGLSYAVCEIEPPGWFDRFQANYTIFTKEDLAKLSEVPHGLFGAGLNIRKTVWLGLRQANFEFNLSDATGTKLSRGGDSELSFAIREAGWKLAIDPALRVQHFIPAYRLNWAYLRRLNRESAISTVTLDAYNLPPDYGTGMKSRLRKIWVWHAMVAVKALLKDPRTLLLAPFCAMEGDSAVFSYEGWRGRLIGLLRLRSKYNAAVLKQRRWKVRDPHS
jgi:glycosyltransferase involved in cell wall biosynthesis